MSPLTPDLFTRRFSDLIEIGRARLRPLAPEWTDHNAHDPGITLMELLAWVAEAQLYSLSHLRRDERLAYAALLGLEPKGTQGATGVIWPDRADPGSPVTTFSKSLVISRDAVVNLVGTDTPTFRPAHQLLWAPGRITSLASRLAEGRIIDHTRVNERGGPPFLPFGEGAGRRDVLAMTFECRDEAGLFGANRPTTRGALWAIGVLAAPASGASADSAPPAATCRSALAATLVSGDRRLPLRIVSDSTQGMLSSGVILLDLDAVTIEPREFTIELRAPEGIARPPRVLRIEPNVVPILQGQPVTRELHVATGMPDWSVTLDLPGLRYAAGEEPATVEVAEPVGLNTWRRCERLLDHGPRDHVYEMDPKAGQITFGNNVNGRIPPAASQVLVSYAVSDGVQGGVARNRKWQVAGFAGSFGVNLEAVAGGAAASGTTDDRREARRRSRQDHGLVSEADIVAAALAIPLLEVGRAWVVPHEAGLPRTGVVTLVAMRRRPGQNEPEQIPETRRWLEAVRRQLAPRMPLGTRLAVVAPRYADFAVRAQVEAVSGRDPAAVVTTATEQLRRRLALIDASPGVPLRQPGVPVTQRDVAAWLRAAEGVQRVIQLQLQRADGSAVNEIRVPAGGLPRQLEDRSTIDVVRRSPGSAS